MSFLVYFFVLLAAAGSVLFGLDWLQAPLPPMPQKVVLQASRAPPAKPPAPRAELKTKQADARLSPAFPTSLGPPQTFVPQIPEQAQARGDNAAAQINATGSSAPAVAQTASTGQPAKCDVDACTDAYQSFRVSDCTYQPSNGPRRLCTKGKVPIAARTTAAGNVSSARAQACNAAACERAYGSFNASDCTYQPLQGPRRLCTK
jgi:hypothetical protein